MQLSKSKLIHKTAVLGLSLVIALGGVSLIDKKFHLFTTAQQIAGEVAGVAIVNANKFLSVGLAGAAGSTAYQNVDGNVGISGVITDSWDSTINGYTQQLFLKRLQSGSFDGSSISMDVGMGQGLANLVGGASINSAGNGYNYNGTRGASRIELGDGALYFFTGALGGSSGQAAGTAVTWSNGGNPAMSINNSGNVGIGTISPGGPLDVNGRASATSLKVASSFTDLINNSPWYGIGVPNFTDPWGNSPVQVAGYGGVHLQSAGVTLTVASTTGVGIGTRSPGAKLEVHSDNDSSQGIKISNTGYDSAGWVGEPYHGSLYASGNAYWNGSSWQKYNGGQSTSLLAVIGDNYAQMVWCAGFSTEAANSDCEVRFQHNAAAVFEHGTTTATVDVAEYYPITDQSRLDQAEGDIVEAQNGLNVSVKRSNQPYTQSLIGIVSTKPGLILGNEDAKDLGELPDPNNPNATPPPTKNPPNAKPVALAGRIPTKVTSLNGNINPGDSITSSTLFGIGMKATKPGAVVAKALESTENWNEQNCPTVPSLDSINWPTDDGTNPNHPCFRLSDGTYVGKIMALVNVSWYDPNVNLTSTAGFSLNLDQLYDTFGNLVSRVGAFGKLIVGKIEAGIVETQKLIVNGVDILERLNSLSQKVDSQQKEIDSLKNEIQQLKTQ